MNAGVAGTCMYVCMYLWCGASPSSTIRPEHGNGMQEISLSCCHSHVRIHHVHLISKGCVGGVFLAQLTAARRKIFS